MAALNLTIALLQIAWSSTNDAANVATASAAIADAAAWTPPADLAVFPQDYLLSDQHVDTIAALAAQHEIAIAVTYAATSTVNHTSNLVLWDRTGTRVLARSQALPFDPHTAFVPHVANLSLGDGGRRHAIVGAVLGAGSLWAPMHTRTLMLAGAEVVIAPVASPSLASDGPCIGYQSQSGCGLDDAMLLTRAWENAGAFIRVNHVTPARGNGFSAVAVNGPDGNIEHAAFVAGPFPVRNGGKGGAERASVDLEHLREIRATTIWGDAFRHPWAYQKLCGFGTPPIPPPVPASSETGGNVKLTVAALQLDECYNATACLSAAEAAAREAAAKGADVAILPEMFSVGYSAQYPGYTRGEPHAKLKAAYDWARLGQTPNGIYITKLAALAKELGMAIAASFMQEDPATDGGGGAGPPRNSVALLDKQGRLQYVYSKVHTCDWGADEATTQPGRQFFTGLIELGGGADPLRVGSMICAARQRFAAENTFSHRAALHLHSYGPDAHSCKSASAVP